TGNGRDIVLGDSGSIDYVSTDNDEARPDVITSDTAVGDGADTIIVGDGNNIVVAGNGNDSINSGVGNDFIIGDSGALTFGTTGNLRTATNPGTSGGDDTIVAGAGDNVVVAGIGTDHITTGNGRDIVLGDSGSIDYVITDNDEAQPDVVTSNYAAGDANDTIIVGDGSNIVIAGSGNDSVTSGVGNDFILGDSGVLTFGTTGNLRTATNPGDTGGNDTIAAGNGINFVIGGIGADSIIVGTGNDVVLGDSGSIDYVGSGPETSEQYPDRIESAPQVGDGDDHIEAGEGSNFIIAGNGLDTVSSGQGDDLVLGDAGFATFNATGSYLVVSSTETTGKADQITIAGGNNIVIGGGGNDEIATGSGGDVILGDEGSIDYTIDDSDPTFIDRITSAETTGGDDQITSGDGDNIIVAGNGNDVVTSGNGKDFIIGDSGSLTFGTSGGLRTASNPGTSGGNDTIVAGNGTNVVIAGIGQDHVTTGSGRDIVLGDSGSVDYVINDNNENHPDVVTSTAVAGDAQDTIIVGDGDNIVIAGNGNDSITSGIGNDFIIGDSGTLNFGTTGNLRNATNPGTSGGNDTIVAGNGTNVVIAGIGQDHVTTGSGRDIVLGDSGSVDYVITDNNETYPDVVTSSAVAGDAQDTIIVGDGDNIVIAGNGDDSITSGVGNDFIIGDSGTLNFGTTGNLRTAVNPGTTGGNDTINITGGNNVVLAGVGSDSVTTGAGRDIVLGDSGTVDYVIRDNNELHPDVITSDAAELDGADTIAVGAGDNIVIAGNGNDTISAGIGRDFIIGDSGVLTFGPTGNLRTAVNPGNSGGNDLISASDGINVVIGGVGSDTILTGTGRDVVLGDSGSIDYVIRDNDTANPDVITSVQTSLDGNDVIQLGNGNNIAVAGRGNDTVTSGIGNDFVLGDSGVLIFDPNGNLRSAESPDVTGGDDNITIVGGNNTVIGGSGKDQITTGNGTDIILGDFGTVDYVVTDNDVTDIDRITAPASLLGDNDTINSGDGEAFIFGGSGSDVIVSGAGRDLIFGDHGQLMGDILPSMLPLTMLTDPFTFTSIDTQSSWTNTDDFIRGGAGDDIIIGGQGADRIRGESGDDDIIGGHNVADGADASDTLDGGSGHDVITGDNASILREPRQTDVRWRLLSGSEILGVDGNGAVLPEPQVDPAGRQKRTVTLLNHLSTTLAVFFGNDQIAGGSGDDVIFGQLGNDAVQGDGSVLNTAGMLTHDIVLTQISTDDIDGIGTDGDDYVEGGGGNDIILGNLGQDDLIGGSSNLFGTTSAGHRPDGQDIIYGGSGTQTSRNHSGDESLNGHSRDADVILGDNGNILRLVGINGTAGTGYIRYLYDTYGSLPIIPRTTQYLEYAFGGPNVSELNDVIYGESGDDIIHGMAGNDVIFGDGQDDNLIGGAGNDRLFGGSGEDGILGDDGRIFTSRNGLTEPLNGITTTSTQATITLPATLIGAVVNVQGRLKKSVDLASYQTGGHDVVYGGLGDDFIHGGAGDDALSGAEATAAWYIKTPLPESSLLNYNPTTRMFAAYNPVDPLSKISNFLLNFEASASNGAKISDGIDSIFGDEGNDWLVGGTLADRMFGGMGDDLLNADDNLETNSGLNNAPDAPLYADADFAFGGGGFDVMIANTGAERLIDWVKRFNTYVVPVVPTLEHPAVANPTVLRDPSPILTQFLRDLAFSSGFDSDTDPVSNAFHAELGIVTFEDGDTWQAQLWQAVDRDPVPGNLYQGIDTLGGFETISAAGIRLVETTGITVSEYRTSRAAHVALTSPPLQNVVLNVVSLNTGEATVSPSTLTFTPLNWFIPQAFTVTGVDDAIIDGNRSVNVTISVNTGLSAAAYSAVPSTTLTVTNTDNDLTIPVISSPTASTTQQRPVISWNADPAASGYDVWITNVSTQQNPVVSTSTLTNSFTPAADLGIGVYDVWVRSFRSDGIKGRWSNAYRFQIMTAVTIQTPASVQPSSRPVISWTPLAGAVKYDVWLNNTTTGQSEVVRNQNVTTANWTPSFDLPLSGYRIWVRGIDASGRAANWSIAADFRVATAPTAVEPLASTFDRTPLFAWTPVAGAVSYSITVRNMTNGLTIHNVQNIVSTSWTAPADLQTGNYRWWVQAIGTNGVAANWSSAIDFHVGGAARFSNPSSSYSQTPTFNWLAVGGAARYELQINRVDIPQADVLHEYNLTGTSYTVPFTLVSGGSYRIWIRAISTSGENGPWSTGLTFSVAALTPIPGERDQDLTEELLASALSEILSEIRSSSGVETDRAPHVRVDSVHHEYEAHAPHVPVAISPTTDVDVDSLIEFIVGELLIPPVADTQAQQI
ncbi:MAG: hypothetical protein JNL58_15515, partial [Planctomyces sp.]|nr:hypothetical protein [Planctomyces sp.]